MLLIVTTPTFHAFSKNTQTKVDFFSSMGWDEKSPQRIAAALDYKKKCF